MQDLANELPRIYIPRTSVNNPRFWNFSDKSAKNSSGIHRPLLGLLVMKHEKPLKEVLAL